MPVMTATNAGDTHYVRMFSVEYGSELYKYDSEAEAMEGSARLLKKAHEHFVFDGIHRGVEYLGTDASEFGEAEWGELD